jgi:hypothetical protein
MDAEFSLREVVFQIKDRTMDNVQNVNGYADVQWLLKTCLGETNRLRGDLTATYYLTYLCNDKSDSVYYILASCCTVLFNKF